MKKTMLELFSGSGKISRSFQRAGYKTTTVDVRKRKGVCEPDIRADIGQITIHDLPSNEFDVVWVGLPCDIWSYAAKGHHWTTENLPKTKKCLDHIDLLHHTLSLLEQINTRYLFLENPRGHLRNYEYFQQWMKRRGIITYTVTLSSYGFPTTKPTNIFTNLDNWIVRPLDDWGRGAKCAQLFDNMTKAQRQSTPVALIEDIINVIECNENY